MNQRQIIKTEQGEGTSLIGKLVLTPIQRKVVLKWALFSLSFLFLQVLQDVVFSRIRILGGCPDIVPAWLLLVCLTQNPDAGALYVLGCCTFRCLCGAALGPVSLAVLVFAGVLLNAMRRSNLWGEVRSVMVCCWIALLAHQLLLFGLGLFLGHTVWDRLLATLGGCFGAWAAVPILYPVARALGKIGGQGWNE